MSNPTPPAVPRDAAPRPGFFADFKNWPFATSTFAGLALAPLLLSAPYLLALFAWRGELNRVEIFATFPLAVVFLLAAAPTALQCVATVALWTRVRRLGVAGTLYALLATFVNAALVCVLANALL
ncbi:MAG: hypothetical protein IKK39_14955 [Thermoguttaceae bacterium]|nr:hypothetical protein [Thermoguttaceae bacterium]MBR4105343.1 hypothetical protein [Thermoguttaceae bacterium]